MDYGKVKFFLFVKYLLFFVILMIFIDYVLVRVLRKEKLLFGVWGGWGWNLLC